MKAIGAEERKARVIVRHEHWTIKCSHSLHVPQTEVNQPMNKRIRDGESKKSDDKQGMKRKKQSKKTQFTKNRSTKRKIVEKTTEHEKKDFT